MKNQDRFKGKVGSEYELFKLACPHYPKVQDSVKKAIEKYCKNDYTFAPFNTSKEIFRVLEIGCGDGETTKRILASDPRIMIDAVEKNKLMIEKATQNLDDSQLSRINFINKDIMDFTQNFKPKNLDSLYHIIASGWTLHNLLDSQRVELYQNFCNILHPGGLFVNADKYAQDNSTEHTCSLYWQIKKFSDVYLNPNINRKDLYDDWLLHYLEDNEPTRIMKIEETIQKMQSSGFVNISCTFREKMDATLVAYRTNPIHMLLKF